MSKRKTEKEIAIMREGGVKLRQVLDKVLREVRPGVTKRYLDDLVTTEIEKLGAKPSFKVVPGYRWASCVTVNNEVVHGIPNDTQLKSGDIVGIDIGLYFGGFHLDMATTVGVGKTGKDRKKFLEAGKKALAAAIKQARAGNRIGDISLAIQKQIEANGYSPVRVLSGHGVGRRLHEDPVIPGFLEKDLEKTPRLEEGMTLAIEVIYNQGAPEVVLTTDGWTIVTKDGKISGLFEETVAITDGGSLVLTN